MHRMLFVLLLVVLCSAKQAAAQAQSEARSLPPFSAPGELVDVGSWRLHLNCTGEARAGQPTVIPEPSVGDFSVQWSLVQPGVAKFTRVCSYDRAGDGWSGSGITNSVGQNREQIWNKDS